MLSHFLGLILFPLMVKGQISGNHSLPAIPLSNLTVYNKSNGVFYGCFKLESNEAICANSSQTYVHVKKGNGQILFDIRETPKYEFRRLGNFSLVKFKNQKEEKRLLVNNLIFESQEQVDSSYLADVDEKEFENEAKQLMMNGYVDSLAPLADSINELDLSKEQQKAVRPILVLAMNTLRAESNLKANGQLKMKDSKYIRDKQFQRRKRSSRCDKPPEGPSCLGMCGPGCWWCWRFVCGDCCFHQGCYDHDLCCQKNFISRNCLSPVRLTLHFSCKRYRNCGRKPKRTPGCFPAEATVQQKNSKVTFLRNLRVGDEILTVNGDGKQIYTKVLVFLDYKPHFSLTYLRVRFTDGQDLIVSKHHLVFKLESGNTKVAVFAEEIAVGDHLFKLSKYHMTLQPVKVISMKETEGLGAFAPLTDQGTLLIDGVLTSCYAEIRSHRLAHFALAPLRLWKSWFPSKEIQDGIHWYAEQLQKGVQEIKPFLPETVSDVFG